MSKVTDPIGVFDSGLGGLTVLKEITALMPSENTIYFGDTGRTPYGSKSPETVIKYSTQISRFLLQLNIKLLVIACNTASAAAYRSVSRMAGIPVVEVITPGAAAAVQSSQNQRIGVIGTKGTIASQVYVDAIRQQARPKTEIFQQACPLFVSLAEEGWWDHEVSQKIADIYLQPLIEQDVDTLVLGCTHYPLLKKVIQRSMGPNVRLIDAGSRVAQSVRQVLLQTGQANDASFSGRQVFYTSDSVDYFQQLGSRFLDQPIRQTQRIDIEQYQV